MNFSFSEVLEKYPHGIKIVSREKINFGSFVRIVSSEGDIFICKPGDIRYDDTIDALDIFVVKEVGDNDDYGRFGEVIVDSWDSDVKVWLEDARLHNTLYQWWWYADSIRTKNMWSSYRTSLATFAYCRLRDLYVWHVPEYVVRP